MSKFWTVFKVDGKWEPMVVEHLCEVRSLQKEFEEMESNRTYDTLKDAHKSISNVLFQQWYDMFFQEQIVEPLGEAAEQKRGFRPQNLISFVKNYANEISFHTIAANIWQEGMKIEVRLVPIED